MKRKMTVALDAMGGDNAPHEICKGAIDACGAFSDLEVVLTGDEERIRPHLEAAPADVRARLGVVHAPEIIEMDEQPAVAIRRKRSSSLRVAMEMVRSGEAQGCASTGRPWGRPCRPSSAVPSCWTSGPTCAVNRRTSTSSP